MPRKSYEVKRLPLLLTLFYFYFHDGKNTGICIAGKSFSLAKEAEKMEEKLARAISLSR